MWLIPYFHIQLLLQNTELHITYIFLHILFKISFFSFRNSQFFFSKYLYIWCLFRRKVPCSINPLIESINCPGLNEAIAPEYSYWKDRKTYFCFEWLGMPGRSVSLGIALDSFIVENRFFSNTIYPNHSFLSLYSFQPNPTFLLPQV